MKGSTLTVKPFLYIKMLFKATSLIIIYFNALPFIILKLETGSIICEFCIIMTTVKDKFSTKTFGIISFIKERGVVTI